MSEKLLHRDDLPYEVVEELQKQFAAQFPGMTMQFAGDAPEGLLPDHVKGLGQQIEQLHMESILKGTCLDCGEQMPNYNPDEDGEWQPAEGWSYYTNSDDTPMCWICPACDQCTDGSRPVMQGKIPGLGITNLEVEVKE